MRTRGLRFACVLLLVMGIACGDVAPGGGGGTGDEVTIALVAPMTGAQSDVGKFNENAARMAVDDVNEAGGIEGLDGAQLNLKIVDVTSEPSGAVSAVNRLLTTGGTSAAFGLGISPLTLPVQPVFERKKIPLLVQAISDDITAKGFEYTFQISPKGSQFGETQVEFLEYLGKQQGKDLKKAAIIYESSEYGTTTAEGVRGLAEGAGLDLVLDEGFQRGLSDASPVVSAIARSGAEVLFPVAYTTDAQLILDSMASQGVDPLIVGGGAGFIWPAMAEGLGDRINGLFSVASWNWDSQHIQNNEELQEITQRYEERFGTFMPEHSGMVYAQVWLLVEAMNQAQSSDPEEIKAALEELDVSEGAPALMQPGRVNFDETGWNEHAYPVMIQWQDGAPRTVYPTEDASVEIPKA